MNNIMNRTYTNATRCAKLRMGHSRQTGSILVMVISMLAITVLLFALVVNYNHWNYKKTLIADVAALVAEAGIRNQLTYRAAGSPETPQMIDEMVKEQELTDKLNSISIEYEFGLTEGGVYVSTGTKDPDPAYQPFNTMRVKICTPLDDVSGSFNLAGKDTCVWAESKFELGDCYCKYAVCPVSKFPGPMGGLNRGVCLLTCTIGSTLKAALNLVFTLNISDLFIALDCILDTLVTTVNTVVSWTLGSDTVKLTYTRYT